MGSTHENSDLELGNRLFTDIPTRLGKLGDIQVGSGLP